MKDKKRLLIYFSLFLLTLLSVFMCSHFVSLFNDDNNNFVDSNKDVDDDIENVENDNHSTISLDEITLNDDGYLWKMKVVNLDGAYVYNENNTIISKLEYGTEICVFGDRVSYHEMIDESITEWPLVYGDLKDIEKYYSVVISYSIDGGNNENGYVKYTDVALIDGNDYNFLIFDENEKYYVSNGETYLYDGPGLLFKNENSIIIPEGEVLNVDKYNWISTINGVSVRKWLYVEYNNQSGWVLECRYNSVNEPYDVIVDDCVDDMSVESGKLKINQDNINLYKHASSDEKIAMMTKGVEIVYDYVVYDELGVYSFHIDYEGTDGFIVGKTVSEEMCENLEKVSDDGRLYIVLDVDGNIRNCG